MRKRPLFLYACIFLTGLLLRNYGCIGLAVVPVLCMAREIFGGGRWKRAAAIALIFAFGLIHMSAQIQKREQYLSKLCDGEKVTVWGEVVQVKIHDDQKWNQIQLTDVYIRFKGETMACNDVLVYSSKDRFSVGQIHKITGKFQNHAEAANEGGFDSRAYYQSLKVDFLIYEEEGDETILQENPSQMKAALLSFKERMREVYYACLPKRCAGFLMSVVAGDRTGLETDLKERFTDGGIAHILAVSALHVSIIGQGFYRFCRKRGVGFYLAGGLAALLLFAYAFLVGGGMSALRAVGMMCLSFLAAGIGRSYDMLNSLGTIVFLLLLENPFLVGYSGFWFSILALIGIGVVAGGQNGWKTSIAISLTTLPLVAYSYYEVPLYSPVLNFFLIPLMTPMFALALLGVIVGMVSLFLGRCLLLPCVGLLWIYETACDLVAKLPFAMILTGKPRMEVCVLYYLFFAAAVFFFRRKKRLPMAFFLGVGLLLLVWPKEHPKEIAFLDVGQGDGIYLSTGDGVHLFIDGGNANSKTLGTYTILPFLKSKGIGSIDYWIVSHGDEDHISGLKEVLTLEYPVRHLVVAELAKEDEKIRELIRLAEHAGTEVLYMKTGDRIVSGECSFTCLYPGEEERTAYPSSIDRNEGSLVLLADLGRFGEREDFLALFSGDISAETEEYLKKTRQLPEIALYKAAHHGSKYSNSVDFLGVISPEWAVISCGKNNVYGHPGAEAVSHIRACGAEIFYTMDTGEIRFWEEKGRLQIEE